MTEKTCLSCGRIFVNHCTCPHRHGYCTMKCYRVARQKYVEDEKARLHRIVDPVIHRIGLQQWRDWNREHSELHNARVRKWQREHPAQMKIYAHRAYMNRKARRQKNPDDELPLMVGP